MSPASISVPKCSPLRGRWHWTSTGAKAMSAPFLFAMESLVDVVVCQQDKPVAAAEMRRAVVKGGRSAVATSRSDDEIPLMRELRRVAERRLPRSVGQDRLRGRERARCGTLRRWLAERDRLQGPDPRAYDRLWRIPSVRDRTGNARFGVDTGSSLCALREMGSSELTLEIAPPQPSRTSAHGHVLRSRRLDGRRLKLDAEDWRT